MQKQQGGLIAYIILAGAVLGLAIVASFTSAYMLIHPAIQRVTPIVALTSKALTRLPRLSGLPRHPSAAPILHAPASTMSHQYIPPPSKTLPNISLQEAINHRRSTYALTSTLPPTVDDITIEHLIRDTVLHIPSAFNSQTTRIVLLVQAEHRKFWRQASEILKAKSDPEKRERTEKRLKGFESAYGSVLFFEDTATVRKMQDASPAYANLFPGWSEQTSGMHQIVLWSALEAFGKDENETQRVGCNLQHYHYEEDVEMMVKETWGLPEEWSMKAQLVFGGVEEGGWPREGKEKLDTRETVRVFGVSEEDGGGANSSSGGSRINGDGTMERR